uniref:TPR_REGION domain-containing protein n=2 Tax=Mesocestoides corti TaxID=53468 RepID=A0A5K3FW86_MESCO
MTVGKDWLAYLFEPQTLLADLNSLSDDTRVLLMRDFLSQAELHDRRSSTFGTDSAIKQAFSDFGLPDETSPQSGYDKSKMLDCLSLQIAASFQFNTNIFAGVVTELPLRLSSRLYRTLFLTLLEKNSRGAKDEDIENGTCTTPYDLGPWENLEPTLAFAALAYHLWCLQVAFSESLLSQPYRNLTPVVAGLSEVPDLAFLPDSRADRDAILMRHEESAARLHDLLKCLEGGVVISRPTPAFFSSSTRKTPEEEVLSTNRLVAGVSFALGRLAFQHNLVEKAVEFLTAAQKAFLSEKLDLIEEAGATPGLIESYLAGCSSSSSIKSLTDGTGSCFCLVDSFCAALKQGLDSGDPDYVLLLVASVAPMKANLRASPAAKDARKNVPKNKINNQPQFSQEEIIASLEADLSQSDDATHFLGFGLRQCLEQLTHRALTNLANKCIADGKPGTQGGKQSKAKELTQLKRAFNNWQMFYTRVVVYNGIKSILQASSVQIAAFCQVLLDSGPKMEDETAPFTASINIEEAASLLLKQLDRLLVEKNCRVISFLSDLVVRISTQRLMEKQTASSSAMVFVDSLIKSSMVGRLPAELQTLIQNLTTDDQPRSNENEDIFSHLPDPETAHSPSPLVHEEPTPHLQHQNHSYRSRITDIRAAPKLSPISLLVASSNPKVVIKSCGDLINSGWTPEAVLRSGGWADTTLVTLLKWTTPGDFHVKAGFQRREPPSGGFAPPSYLELNHRQLIGVISENPQSLPALVLLLRAIDFRKDRLNWEQANAFRLAAGHLLPPGAQGPQAGIPGGSVSGAPPLWCRSLVRWIRVALEHEAFLLDLLESLISRSSTSVVFRSTKVNADENELLRRSKSALLQVAGVSNDLGPDAVVSEDLLSAASCFILKKEPTFLSTLNGGSQVLELIRCLYRLENESEEPVQAARDLYNLLCNWLRPVSEAVSANASPHPPPVMGLGNTTLQRHVHPVMPKDIRLMIPFVGTPPPHAPPPMKSALASCPSTDPLHFLVWLLTELRDDNDKNLSVHLLDHLNNCLAAILSSVQPVFKTDSLKNPWPSVTGNTAGGLQPTVVASLLHFLLARGHYYAPQNVSWLLLNADLELASPNPNPRIVLPLLLQAGAAASDFFSYPVASNIFTKRVVSAMVHCCVSLGFLGEAVVLCQLAAERSLIKLGVQIIESLESLDTSESANFEKTYDSLDGLSVFLWDIELLESLATLELQIGSQSKRMTFMRCINQPELNTSNAPEILQMTQAKRATEFLRYLCQQIME